LVAKRDLNGFSIDLQVPTGAAATRQRARQADPTGPSSSPTAVKACSMSSGERAIGGPAVPAPDLGLAHPGPAWLEGLAPPPWPLRKQEPRFLAGGLELPGLGAVLVVFS
jgi:hypothetical protein